MRNAEQIADEPCNKRVAGDAHEAARALTRTLAVTSGRSVAITAVVLVPPINPILIAIFRAAIVSVTVLLYGCTTVPPLPQINGPTAELEIGSSTLKARSAFYPDETVKLVVFRTLDNTRLGGDELTILASTKVVQLPANAELRIRLFKSMALMGASVICIGETVATLSPNARYRAAFDFEYNYEIPSLSKCTGSFGQISSTGQLLSSVPLDIVATRHQMPLIIPVPAK